MNATNVPESSTFSFVRASTSSHTTASAGAPCALSTARAACSEICVSISSSEIEPSFATPSSLRSESTTLASSRATSARITSPAGLRAAPASRATLQTESELSSSSSARSVLPPRVTIRRWITGAEATRGRGRARTRPVHGTVAFHPAAWPDGRPPPGAVLQDPLQDPARHSAWQSEIQAPRDTPPEPFRPTPRVPFRTHVPRADDTPAEQALAPRAGARCRGNGTRVRDAGRGNARPRGCRRAGSPAALRSLHAAGRPHRRPPAPPAPDRSATRAPRRHRPPARPGLPYAATSPGGTAVLTAARRPVWEDGSAGRPGALPGAPDFNASRAAPHRVARVRCRRRGPSTTTSRPGGRLVKKNRRRPTLPGPCEPSTIGAVGLNCSVRNGKRCFPHAIATGNCSRPGAVPQNCTALPRTGYQSVKPSTQLVPVSYVCHHTSRSGLSTWWSTRGLTPSRGWESSSRGRLPA